MDCAFNRNSKNDNSQIGHKKPEFGETVEVSREKKFLPGMSSLLAFGTKKIFTRQVISNVFRLTSPCFSDAGGRGPEHVQLPGVSR